jgi:hypothetical protein
MVSWLGCGRIWILLLPAISLPLYIFEVHAALGSKGI